MPSFEGGEKSSDGEKISTLFLHILQAYFKLPPQGYQNSNTTVTYLSSTIKLAVLIDQNDQRHLVLECVAEERQQILMSYVEDLERRGLPPPPTATDPSLPRKPTK